MILKLIFLSVFVYVEAAYEGDPCSVNGRDGTCITILKCKSAIEDLKNRRNPKICGFDGSVSIVCCFDNAGAAVTTTPKPPVATTMKRPVQTTSTSNYPNYDYKGTTADDTECGPVPAKTSAKTGQKAFDKCIEYQEKLVYPCVKSVSFIGGMTRPNRCHHNADELILGGNDTLKHEFPHMAMLGYGNDPQALSWLCGGTIISDRFVLTAGHCIASREAGPITYVVAGAHTRQDALNEDNRYKVKNIVKHPQYEPPQKYNDIALVETEKTMKLSEYVVPACLHIGDPVADDRVLATGWGFTEYKGSVAEIMQKVILNKFSSEECSVKYPVHKRHMKIGLDPRTQICYGDRSEVKDTCQGDSGGPLQIKSRRIECMYAIVGVTSFGKGCGTIGEPAVYTRVSHYVPWIESIVWP